ISAWEQQVLFLQEQQVLFQQEQQQVQESAWMSADPLQEQQVQEQQQVQVPELLLFSCSRLRKPEPGSGKVRARSSFSCDTYLFPFVIKHCQKQGMFNRIGILFLCSEPCQYFFSKKSKIDADHLDIRHLFHGKSDPFPSQAALLVAAVGHMVHTESRYIV